MEYALEGGLLDNSWSSWKNMVMFDIIVEYLTILWNILQHPSISNSFWQYHQSSTNLIQDFAVLKLFGVWINQWITCIEELSLLKNTSLAPFTTRLRWKSQTKLNWETISLPPGDLLPISQAHYRYWLTHKGGLEDVDDFEYYWQHSKSNDVTSTQTRAIPGHSKI